MQNIEKISPDQETCLQYGYQLKQQIGTGGFGTSYLAWHIEQQQHDVIKVFSLPTAESYKNIASFETEIKTLSRLKHPSIPRYITYFKTEQAAYLVQAYIKGKTLEQWVKEKQHHFQEAEVAQLALQLCEILDYLHHLSPPIIHRDIKPANIILTEDRTPYLIDFGAVKYALVDETHHTETTSIVGTFGYMPYEQFLGRITPAADIYAMGCTLIFLLTHKNPAEMKIRDMRLDFHAYLQVSAEFQTILDKMLQFDPEWRYQSAKALKQALRHPDKQTLQQRQAGRLKPREKYFAVGLLLLCLTILGYRDSNTITGTTDTPLHLNLVYQGQPIRQVSQVEPSYILNDSQGRIVDKTKMPRYQPESDRFVTHALSAGQHNMIVDIDANPDNPQRRAGDFRGWRKFQIQAEKPRALTIHLKKYIRLLQPFDSSKIITALGKGCEESPRLSHTPVFTWETLGQDIEYHAQIYLFDCTYSRFGPKVKQIKTLSTSVQFELSTPPQGQIYAFYIKAFQQISRHPVGIFSAYGHAGKTPLHFTVP